MSFLTKPFILFFCVAALSGCASLNNTSDDSASSDTASTELPSTAKKAIALGDSELLEDKPEKALEYYVRALDIEPKSVDALFKIGTVHQHFGNQELAIKAYDLLLQTDPKHAAALEESGLILLDQRRYDAAAQRLDVAAKQDGKSWRALNGLGLIADERKDYKSAIGYFEQALQINRESAQLFNNLGYAKYLVWDMPGAAENYRKALKLEPGHEQASHNLGLLLVRQGRTDEALAVFLKTMKEAEAYNNIGYISLLDGNYPQAEEYLEKAISISPTYQAQAHANLDRLYDVWQR